MTDRLDLNRVRNLAENAPSVTPSAIINLCLDERTNQNNIKFLEQNHCSVSQLKVHLSNQITESDINAEMFGARSSLGEPLVTKDTNLLMQFIEREIKAGVEKGGNPAYSAPTFEEIIDFITQENTTNAEMFEDVMFALKASGYNPVPVQEKNKYKTINKYCDDLVIQASTNRLDPMIGREKEVTRIIEVLARYKKKNPLLIGEAGVGKTAVIEGLASAIAQGKVPDALKGAKVYSTSVSRLMAGSRFRGDVEEKVEALLKELQKHEEETCSLTFLFIDEIHQICSAGSNNQDGSNISNIIKPALSSGKISLIGATTRKEYKRTILKDDALNRRFQVIRIEEPSDADTIEILRKGIAPVLTNYHGVKYPKSVIIRAVELSSKYLTDKAQPDKSISILDSIGARLRTTELRPSARVSDVEKLVAAITGTPVSAFKQKTTVEEYVDIEKELNLAVFGQAQAVKKITEIYERSKAGLSEEGQPIGSILAVGPTGVGKTEVAKSLAKVTKSHFFKINMGEYTEKHSVSKLFGAPPGYKGHGDGGLLTNEIRRNPHCVLLLDEIEKAHPKVFEALLGIIDGAKMTDGEGNEVDFSNTMIIMTSNVGAAQAANRKIINLTGNSETVNKAKGQVSTAALESTFSPEFRNKLTAVVNFNSLGESEIRMVTDKFLKKAQDRIFNSKGIKVEFSEEIYKYIAKNGFDPKFGARPVKKLIDSKVIDALIKPILKGEIKKDDTVIFEVDSSGDIVYTKKEEITVEV